jgi:MoaA/NifB/PqqE/SkfB family radical SAM enzyme
MGAKKSLYWERNPKRVEEQGYVFDRACFYLYRAMLIYPGGGVTPCCFAHDERQDFGNLYNNSVSEIWNNKRYRSARMLFSHSAPTEDRPMHGLSPGRSSCVRGASGSRNFPGSAKASCGPGAGFGTVIRRVFWQTPAAHGPRFLPPQEMHKCSHDL